MTRTRLYWICQLAGWAAALGAFVGLASLTGGFIGPRPVSVAQVAFGTVLVYAMCVGGTHAIHAVAVRRGWVGLPLLALAPRLAGAAVASAVGTGVVSWALSALAEPLVNPLAEGPLPAPSPGEFAGSALMTASIFLVWATVYALAVTAFRLADAERDRLTLRATLAESRMRALEYQLNPHFLFNALNTVRALVLENPAEARRAVTLLSGLLRRTLAAGREATHPLGSELDLVDTYLALEGLRFDGRLRARVEASEAAREVAVPALLVQTLVENAVKHGVAGRRDGGDVVVTAAVEAGRFAIRVENPTPNGPTLADGTGTGLAHARERLALLFSESAALRLTLADGRALAEVTLPADPRPDA